MRSDPFKHLLRLNNEHSEEVPDVDPFLEIRTVPPNNGIEVAFSLIVQLDPGWHYVGSIGVLRWTRKTGQLVKWESCS